MIKPELDKLVISYNDGGDQEGRLTSTRNPSLIIPIDNLDEYIEENGVEEPIDIAKMILPIDKMIIITNEHYADDNFNRKEMIRGNDGKTMIFGFKFGDTNTMDQLGKTIIATSIENEYGGFIKKVRYWIVDGSYESNVKKLVDYVEPRINLDDHETGECEIAIPFIEESPEYKEIELCLFNDHLNSEYFFMLPDDMEEEGE